jgi:hypothetical protein
MTVADRDGLPLIGILVATVTFAVISTVILVVKGNAEGNYFIENSAASMLRIDLIAYFRSTLSLARRSGTGSV